MKRLFSLSALALASTLFCTAPQAHEFWLVPHDAVTRSAEQVVFELRIGPTWPGVQTVRLPNLVASFDAHDALGRQNVDGKDGARAVGHIRPRAPGATVVAMRTNPAYIELPWADFQQYLQEEGLAGVLKSRATNGLEQEPGRENFSRCAKTILLVDQQSMGFDRVVQLPLELVPRTDPLRYRAGDSYTVQLLSKGVPLAGALVKAQLKAEPPVELTARTDTQGNVVMVLPQAGLWLFNAVHMEPVSQPPAQWESLWASLTLELPTQASAK
jgi:uncharacterized GH25 family protein